MSETKSEDRYEGSDSQAHFRPRISSDDHSPDYRGRYDARCWGCWNGNAHSENYHVYAASFGVTHKPGAP